MKNYNNGYAGFLFAGDQTGRIDRESVKMLDYEPWGNPSHQMILANNSHDVVVQPAVVSSDHQHGVVDIFNANNTADDQHDGRHHSALSLDYAHAHHHSTFNNNTFFSHEQPHHHSTSNLHPLYDPRPLQTISYAPHNPFEFDTNNSGSAAAGAGYFLVPKAEDGMGRHVTSRIGLNLGHRTYFSAQDDDFVARLYRRSRPGGFDGIGSVNTARCQAEGCAADLSNAKHYHRRHKVCEFHSKAATVVAGGLTQRFCQQCSRFHLLTEFDNGKRSCRKRLADHNRRRRKTPQQPSSQGLLELQKSPVENSSNNLESPPESSSGITHSSSSVTMVISPPRITLECFGSSSSSSVFYSN